MTQKLSELSSEISQGPSKEISESPVHTSDTSCHDEFVRSKTNYPYFITRDRIFISSRSRMRLSTSVFLVLSFRHIYSTVIADPEITLFNFYFYHLESFQAHPRWVFYRLWICLYRTLIS